MTVEAQIATFLKGHKPRPYCDDCIAKELKLGSDGNRHMARNATAAFAVCKEFARVKSSCTKCGRTKLVTRAN
jgi:hypothetical protein